MINTYEVLKKYNFSIQKKYGQNFLADRNILEGIADAAQIADEDIVLEIGPGLGALTQVLCRRARHVIAVEIDRMLIPILQETLQDYDNYTLVNQDILKTDIAALVRSAVPAEGRAVKVKVVANLPYYITTPIIMALLESTSFAADAALAAEISMPQTGADLSSETGLVSADFCPITFESITVMVQKEVAERMREGVGTKSYGALSLAVQYYSRPEIALHVSKNCFVPKPDVDSAVIHLQVYAPSERPVQAADPAAMFRIIRAAFNQRRKTLVNALSNAADLSYTKEQIKEALSVMEKPETVRGEALTLEEFAALSDILCGSI